MCDFNTMLRCEYAELVKGLRFLSKQGTRYGMACVTINEAADAIEELEKKALNWQATADDHREAYHNWFYAYMRDVPRWISVKERLPECDLGAEVGNIEWISCGMVHAGCFGRGGKYRDEYFRTWTGAEEGIDAKDADYWRAVTLPEPPKEETE